MQLPPGGTGVAFIPSSRAARPRRSPRLTSQVSVSPSGSSRDLQMGGRRSTHTICQHVWRLSETEGEGGGWRTGGEETRLLHCHYAAALINSSSHQQREVGSAGGVTLPPGRHLQNKAG